MECTRRECAGLLCPRRRSLHSSHSCWGLVVCRMLEGACSFILVNVVVVVGGNGSHYSLTASHFEHLVVVPGWQWNNKIKSKSWSGDYLGKGLSSSQSVFPLRGHLPNMEWLQRWWCCWDCMVRQREDWHLCSGKEGIRTVVATLAVCRHKHTQLVILTLSSTFSL